MSLSRSNQKNQRANRLSINSPSSFLNQGTLPKDIHFHVFFVNVDFRPQKQRFLIFYWNSVLASGGILNENFSSQDCRCSDSSRPSNRWQLDKNCTAGGKLTLPDWRARLLKVKIGSISQIWSEPLNWTFKQVLAEICLEAWFDSLTNTTMEIFSQPTQLAQRQIWTQFPWILSKGGRK